MRKDRAREFRAAAVLSAQNATDEQAMSMPTLYPEWSVGVSYGGEGQPSIIRRGEQLYRCQTPHTSQDGWEPENAPAIWVAINKANAGTREDPVPAARGMEYVYGLYYSDPEDSLTYLCTRIGAVDGDTIVLQHLPHELVGQYFETV